MWAYARRALWLAGLLALVGCAAGPAGSSGASQGPLADPNKPTALERDFEIAVYTGARALGGDEVMFSELFAAGKPVVMELWAGLCPVCRQALPEMQTVYEQYEEDVVFVGVDIGAYTGLGNEADARDLYAALKLSFPTGTISDPAVLAAYRVTSIPTTLYFTPNGEVFDRSGGLVTADVLSEEFEGLLAASH